MTQTFPFLRSALWLGFFALILWAWWVMYAMTQSMGMDLFGGMKMPMHESSMAGEMGSANMPMPSDGMSGEMGADMPMADGGMSGEMGQMGSMSMTSASVLIPMWMIMMAAMMGPTFVPTLRTYEDLITTGAGSRGGSFGLCLGFLVTWFAFGLGIGFIHAVLFDIGLLNSMGSSSSLVFSAVLLTVAGIYQFSALKDMCVDHCRTPMVHFLAHWRPGFQGGVIMGAKEGAFCIGCCWAIMSIGFVGGAMNLAWMGIATLIMTLEKLPQIGRWVTKPLGVAFLAGAAWHLAQLF